MEKDSRQTQKGTSHNCLQLFKHYTHQSYYFTLLFLETQTLCLKIELSCSEIYCNKNQIFYFLLKNNFLYKSPSTNQYRKKSNWLFLQTSSTSYCYKRVESFREHCLYTSQNYTEDYIAFTFVIKAIGGSTFSSSHNIHLWRQESFNLCLVGTIFLTTQRR